MVFPDKIIGKCPVCGGNGEYDTDPQDGFASPVALNDFADNLLVGSSAKGTPGVYSTLSSRANLIGYQMFTAEENGLANTMLFYGSVTSVNTDPAYLHGAIYDVQTGKVLSVTKRTLQDWSDDTVSWKELPFLIPVRIISGHKYALSALCCPMYNDTAPSVNIVTAFNTGGEGGTYVPLDSATGDGVITFPSKMPFISTLSYISGIYISSGFVEGYFSGPDGHGLPLVMYQGEYMCKLCKKRKIAEDESDSLLAPSRQEETFRRKAGLGTEIDD